MKKGIYYNILSGTKVTVTEVTDSTVEYTRDTVYVNDGYPYRATMKMSHFSKPIHVFRQTYRLVENLLPEKV
jgi:hypothetical protein